MSYRHLLDDCSTNYSPEVRFYNSDLPFDTLTEFLEWAVLQSESTEYFIECVFGMLLKGDLVNIPVKQLTKRLTSILKAWYQSVLNRPSDTGSDAHELEVNSAKTRMVHARFKGGGHEFANASRDFTEQKKKQQRLKEDRPDLEAVEYACSRYLLNRLRAYHRYIRTRLVEIAHNAWRASVSFEHPTINFYDYIHPNKISKVMRIHIHDRATLSDVDDPRAFYVTHLGKHKLKLDSKLITASHVHFT